MRFRPRPKPRVIVTEIRGKGVQVPAMATQIQDYRGDRPSCVQWVQSGLSNRFTITIKNEKGSPAVNI